MAKLQCRSCGANVTRSSSFCAVCGVRSPAVSNPLSALAQATREPKHGDHAQQRRRSMKANQGVLLGIVGCCFGILGIVLFGLIFVPLAILCSFLGLLRGMMHRSAAGLAASVVGLLLSAVGFCLSPSLLLLTGGLLVAAQSTDNNQKRTSSRAAVSVPERESKFCEITSIASSQYFSLAQEAKKAQDDKNGILEKRAQEAMTNAVRNRNRAILELAQETGFAFDSWNVKILKINNPNNGRVTFSVRPLCSNIVTIHLAGTASGTTLLDTLATKKVGDSLTLSGTFIASRLDAQERPTLPDSNRFEQSMTERGSMEEPEYHAILK